MSDEPPLLTSLTENATDVPWEAGRQDSYVLLLVLLSVFAGGTVILISILLIFCHRCCQGGRRYSRASDDLEKTNTTYVEESQPVQEITIRLDSPDGLSASGSSCHGDVETERFLSTTSTGRRVSFNETAIYDQSKKSTEKGRRYTLTEGDFHHLKKARLTHLHLPPPALKILTIMECESPENSVINMSQPSAPAPSFSIFQPAEGGPPPAPVTWLGQSPSCGLPGDALNSVLDTNFRESPPVPSPEPPRSRTIEVMGDRGWQGNRVRAEGDEQWLPGAAAASGQGTVLTFLTRLRRHASLEGASPYFQIKKWKFDSSQRAASLDMRGSPRRRAFQRQRAASETLDPAEEDTHLGGEFLRSVPHIHPQPPSTPCPRRLSAGSLTAPAGPSPSLGRLAVEAVVEASCSTEGEVVIDMAPELPESPGPQEEEDREELGAGGGGGAVGGGGAGGGGTGPVIRQESLEQHSLYRDIWSLRASLELYASSDLSSNDRDSTRSDADSVCSIGGAAGASRAGALINQSQDIDDEVDGEAELPYEELPGKEAAGGGGGRRRSNRDDSADSERGGSDGEAGSRKLLQMDSGYASMEAPCCKVPEELRLFGGSSGKTASERRHFFISAGHTGTVCESLEARLFKEELELEDALASAAAVTAVAAESPAAGLSRGPTLAPRETPPPPPPPPPKPQPRFRRRDYSIDEKTEALFNEFLRHDPQFDRQESPSPRPRHRASRVHLRKQWQRAKQYSDPGGARHSPALDRQRFPLRRGDSANYPLDTRFHSMLPRIASAADEEASEGATGDGTASEGAASAAETPRAEGSGAAAEENVNNSSNGTAAVRVEAEGGQPDSLACPPTQGSAAEHSGTLEDCGPAAHPTETHEHWPLSNTDPASTRHAQHPPDTDAGPPGTGYVRQTITADSTPSDKLAASLEDRLYTSMRSTHGSLECVVAVARASPDHSQD